MTEKEVLVVRTGVANTASVLAGLSRAGAKVHISGDPLEVKAASHVVLPGVGAMAAAMAELERNGLVEVLRERILAGRPTLAVCLGLQLLCQSSEESPGIQALGVVPGQAQRFPDSVCVPQIGWNRVQPDSGCRLLRPGHAYFANSYRLLKIPPGWSAAHTDHGGPFLSAFEREGVLACQFHPELSGAWGLGLLKRWLQLEDREIASPGAAEAGGALC